MGTDRIAVITALDIGARMLVSKEVDVGFGLLVVAIAFIVIMLTSAGGGGGRGGKGRK